MSISVQILGATAATPAFNRFLTSQVIQINQTYCMIDCGEGTQFQTKNLHVKTTRIDYIFISHLHGDHFFGLPGLLSSMSLHGRTKELYLFGPRGLQDVLITINRVGNASYQFPIHFREIQAEEAEVVLENENLIVSTFPLKHRIPCCGFRFDEAKKKNTLLAEKLPKGFPFELMKELKDGNEVSWEGKTYTVEKYTNPPVKPLSYAFCSDTAYTESILAHIAGVSMLYHEATFIEEESEKAIATKHSTAKQAALIAHKAEVSKLIIGHFSTRYKLLDSLLKEAKSIFPQTFLAIEGEIFTV